MVADSLDKSKGARPFESSALLSRVDWYRCTLCGRTFASAEGLRSHTRFDRCPSSDPLERRGLDESELRSRTRARLREIAHQDGT